MKIIKVTICQQYSFDNLYQGWHPQAQVDNLRREIKKVLEKGYITTNSFHLLFELSKIVEQQYSDTVQLTYFLSNSGKSEQVTKEIALENLHTIY